MQVYLNTVFCIKCNSENTFDCPTRLHVHFCYSACSTASICCHWWAASGKQSHQQGPWKPGSPMDLMERKRLLFRQPIAKDRLGRPLTVNKAALSSGQAVQPASQAGSETGLTGSQTWMAGSQTCMAGSQIHLARSQIHLTGSQTCLGGNQTGLAGKQPVPASRHTRLSFSVSQILPSRQAAAAFTPPGTCNMQV